MALSAKEQSIVDFGKRTGQTSLGSVAGISAASLARINAELARQNTASDDDVAAWLSENAGASDAEIAAAAEQANVDSEQIARVTGLDQSVIDDRLDTVSNTASKIQDVYKNTLKRDADTEGLKYWTDQVSSGALTLDQVTNAISNSDEAQKVSKVVEAYDTYLDREPDQEGLDYWRSEVVSGNLTVNDVINTIATSDESFEKNPTKAITAEIYVNSLGRTPDQEGVDFWDNEINQAIDRGEDPNTVIQNVGQAMVTAERENVQKEAAEAFQKGVENKDPTALANILYSIKQDGQKVSAQELEELFGEGDEGYVNSQISYALMRGMEFQDAAAARGDLETAQRLQQEMQNPEQFFNTYRGGEWLPEDVAKEIRDNLIVGDDFYGRSSGGSRGWFGNYVLDDFLGIDDSGGLIGSTKAFLENPVEALDRWKDRPAFRAGVGLLIGGPAGALASAGLNIVSKYDTGQTPGLADWAALAYAGYNYADAQQAAADFAATADGPSAADLSGSQAAADFAATADGPSALELAGDGGGLFSGVNIDTDLFTESLKAAGDTLTLIESGAQGVVNKILDESGVSSYISKAGELANDPAVSGLLSGTVAGTLEAAKGGNFYKGFLPELKGTSLDVLSNVNQTVGDLFKGLNLPEYTGYDLNDINYDWLNNLSNVPLESVLGNYTGPDLNDINYDWLNNLSNINYTGPDLNDINYDALNNLSNIEFPNINLPNINLPEYTGPDLNDINYDSLNNLTNITIPDINIDIPNINIPKFDFETPTSEDPTTPTVNVPDLPSLPELTLPELLLILAGEEKEREQNEYVSDVPRPELTSFEGVPFSQQVLKGVV